MKIYGSLTGAAYNKYNLYATVEVVARDEENLKSQVYLKFVLENASYTGKYCYNLEKRANVSLKINGVTKGAGNYNIDTRGTLSSVVADFTGWLSHDELGRLDLDIDFSFSQDYTSYPSDLDVITGGSLSGTFSLEPFPVATTPHLPDSITVGTSFLLDLSTSCQSNQYTHNVSYIILDSEYEGILVTAARGNVYCTVPKEAANGILESTASAVFICETYDEEGELVGTKSVSSVLDMPADAAPTLSFSLMPYNQGLASDFDDVFIQGKSKVKAEVMAESEYGATINSYELIVNGVKTVSEESTLLSSVLLKSGTQTVTVKVVDSRGNSAQQSEKISVYEYAVPYLSGVLCEKRDGGLYIEATRHFSLISGNVCPLVCHVKKASEDSYDSGITLLAENDDTNSFAGTVSDVTIEDLYSYDVLLALEDTISGETGAYYFDLNILGEEMAIKFPESHGRSLGIGMVASEDEEERVDNAWRTYHHGGSGTILLGGQMDLQSETTAVLTKSVAEIARYNLFFVDLHRNGVFYKRLLCFSEWDADGIQYIKGQAHEIESTSYLLLDLTLKVRDGDVGANVSAQRFDAWLGSSHGRFSDYNITISAIYAIM